MRAYCTLQLYNECCTDYSLREILSPTVFQGRDATWKTLTLRSRTKEARLWHTTERGITFPIPTFWRTAEDKQLGKPRALHIMGSKWKLRKADTAWKQLCAIYSLSYSWLTFSYHEKWRTGNKKNTFISSNKSTKSLVCQKWEQVLQYFEQGLATVATFTKGPQFCSPVIPHLSQPLQDDGTSQMLHVSQMRSSVRNLKLVPGNPLKAELNIATATCANVTCTGYISMSVTCSYPQQELYAALMIWEGN